MLCNKKCFSLKLCSKKEIKKPKTNNKRKTEKSEKEKMRQNENSKKCIKEICQFNYEKKKFRQSFKPRKEILKLKIKIKNMQ